MPTSLSCSRCFGKSLLRPPRLRLPRIGPGNASPPRRACTPAGTTRWAARICRLRRPKRTLRTVYERLALCRPPPASAQAPRERAQLYFKSSTDAFAFAAAPADEAAKIAEAKAARKEAAKACKRARGARAKTAKKAARQDDDFAGTAWGEDEEAACAEEAPGGDFEALSWEGADGVEEAAC